MCASPSKRDLGQMNSIFNRNKIKSNQIKYSSKECLFSILSSCSLDDFHQPSSEKREAFIVFLASHPQKDTLTGSGGIPNTED
jgi:hypothetical protein